MKTKDIPYSFLALGLVLPQTLVADDRMKLTVTLNEIMHFSQFELWKHLR